MKMLAYYYEYNIDVRINANDCSLLKLKGLLYDLFEPLPNTNNHGWYKLEDKNVFSTNYKYE